MTEKETSSFKKGSRCSICTGCGRCFGERKTDTVVRFCAPEAFKAPGDGSGTGQPEKDFAAVLQPSGDVKASQDFIIAVDIGTTTIAMQLRREGDGEISDSFTCMNPQRQYGADVLSRIEAAEDEACKKAMQDAVRGALKKGVEQFERLLAQRDKREKISRMAIAANTTMLHLLMGYDVSGLGVHPFTPHTLEEVHTDLFGIKTDLLPGVSAFVGADIVAGMCALRMWEREEVTLLLDLGTNGEMVLGNRDRLIAASTAAGPAFEGGGDAHGADLMALAARLLEEGLLDETGLLADPYFAEGIEIGGVHITQERIRQLQMAKSAICTGIGILCEKYGLESCDGIRHVFLAGGMGYYLDRSAAAAIGLFPKELKDRAVAVGNAALQGAFVWKTGTIPEVAFYNLAKEKIFPDRYIENMALKPCGQ